MVLQLKTGVVQGDCSGSMVVPTDGGLVKGQAYYARVFAYSPVGFSQGQVGFQTNLSLIILVHDSCRSCFELRGRALVVETPVIHLPRYIVPGRPINAIHDIKQVAPDPAKPTTVPGRPTSVSVEVYDAQSLKVVFSPPADDGGDTGM